MGPLEAGLGSHLESFQSRAVQAGAGLKSRALQSDTSPPHHHGLSGSLKGGKKELQMENGIFNMLECLGRRTKADSGKGSEKNGRELGMAPCLIPMLLHSTLR